MPKHTDMQLAFYVMRLIICSASSFYLDPGGAGGQSTLGLDQASPGTHTDQRPVFLRLQTNVATSVNYELQDIPRGVHGNSGLKPGLSLRLRTCAKAQTLT